MAISRGSAVAFVLLAVVLVVSFRPSAAEIRVTEVRSDGRTIIPFYEFGFTHTGVLELNVSGISLSDPSPDLDLSQLGFFLSTRDAWIHVLQQLQELDITCALQSLLVKLVYSFDQLSNPNPNPSGLSIPRSSAFGAVFAQSDPGQYTLVFANCLPRLRVSMSVRSAMYNLDPRTGRRAFLSVGAAALPVIYFLLFLAYAALATGWVAVLLRKRRAAFRIHYFMLAVVVLKALNLLCEAEDKSYIERTGIAHGWDVLFYIFSFLKGISLFTLIVLIGTGWSFLKPYLQDRDKKVLMVIISLQVVAPSQIVHRSLSNRRPWSELLDRSTFSCPDSLFDAASHIYKHLAVATFPASFAIVHHRPHQRQSPSPSGLSTGSTAPASRSPSPLLDPSEPLAIAAFHLTRCQGPRRERRVARKEKD